MAFFSIRREVFPNIQFDVIAVTTLFPGAATEEVEKLVTNPLERELKEIDGIKKMTSTTVEGRSLILLQLDIDSTDLEKAKSDVRDVVDSQTGLLPEGTERPIIRSLESKNTPLIEVSVSGNLPPLQLREEAKKLERFFETLPGIASAKPLGLEDREFHVEVSLQKLSRNQLSLEDVIQALKRRNLSIPGGTIEGTPKDGYLEKTVRTSGQFLTEADLSNTVIRANELARPIFLKDVAEVSLTLAKPSVVSHTNGIPSIRITLLKKEHADAIDVVDSLKESLDTITPSLPKGLTLTLINDSSEYVRRRLGVLMGNFTIGLGLVLILLPMFLPFRFSLLIAVGEPFAFLGTILAFQTLDVGLNLISVIGLILVSGILVDDGIVVVENVARLIREGMSPKKAAITGAQQMWVPVVASATTTIIAFAPMASMSGIFGKFIQYIPIGVIIPILISLFENFFIMPHHVGAWLRAKDFDAAPKTGLFGKIRKFTDRFWNQRFMPNYLSVLKWSVRRKYSVLAGSIVFFSLCLLLAYKGMRFVLFPPEGVEVFMIRTQGPIGISLDGNANLIRPIESAVAKLPKSEVKNFLTTVGIHQQDPNDPNTRRGSEYAQIMVYLTPEEDRDRTAQEIIDHLRKTLPIPAGIQRLTFERINPGPPVGKPVSVGIRAEEYETILPAAKAVREIASEISGVSDVQDNYILGKEQIEITPRFDEASAAGLTVGSIGTTVRAAYEGIEATTIQTLDEAVAVRVLLEKDLRTSPEALSLLKISNPTGSLIPLNRVATLGRSQSIASRSHENNQREIRVTGEVDTTKISAREANHRIRKRIAELKAKFPNVEFFFGGEDKDTQESMESLAKAFALAILGIFIILVITFKTLLQPLVVLITIPLGLIAVILTFFLHGLPLSFLGMVGMVGLSGIIVNNAIVFVEFVNEGRRKGLSSFDSLVQAAEYRAMPIFLTTVTTVVGILPTAYGLGGTDKFVVPIAMAMGWGLLVGSLLTLFLLPVALAILDDIGSFGTRVWKRSH